MCRRQKCQAPQDLRCSGVPFKGTPACKPPGCASCLQQGLRVRGSCGGLSLIAVACEAAL